MTGVLASNPTSCDTKIEKFSVTVAGQSLLDDATLELNVGTRYGFIGQNGSGKTNVLNAIALREIPIPDHVDLYHLHAEAEPTDRTAVEAVVDHVTEEIARLEAAQDLIIETSGAEDERLEVISDRLAELDPDTFEFEARKILSGLGFSNKTVPMERATKDMSGGWRMRVSLAKALFAAPTLLLLDEPTNHLDLEACVWLEEHLSHYKKCLLVVSHSQDFLNTVCNKIVWLHDKDLKYYGGNYATFCAQVEAEEKIQLKLFEKQQADMAKLADYVEANHANGKAKSAASKDKVLTKIKAEAVERPKLRENTFVFEFPDCDKLPSPVLPFDGVCFAYDGTKESYLYEELDIGVDCDSRIALVGPNGCGKSTLLKLMAGNSPRRRVTKPHPALVIGRYNQHSAEQLDEKTVFGFFKSQYPNSPTFKRTDEFWRVVGSFSARHEDAKHSHRVSVGRAKVEDRVRDDQHAKSEPSALGRADEPSGRGRHRRAGQRHQKFRGVWCSCRTISDSSTRWRIRFGCARTRRYRCGRGRSGSTKPTSRRKWDTPTFNNHEHS